jgi:hypothetical protein
LRRIFGEAAGRHPLAMLSPRFRSSVLAAAALWLATAAPLFATPANKAALQRHYEQFLSGALNRCTTCHLPSTNKVPETLEEFPHNSFGTRLRLLGEEQKAGGAPAAIDVRLTAIANEDSDGDRVPNEAELLLGTNPGDAQQTPGEELLAELPQRRAAFGELLSSYRWKPFDRVQRSEIPAVQNSAWVRTPIDAFVAAEHERRGLRPRPAAPRHVLLRRVYLDLIGLTPTPEEQLAFAADTAPDAYEKVVDRLLADPRHGERWGRHWMDIWRYSDWAGWMEGKQVRDSQRHIWRWRDWIVESLNSDKPYDQMLREMLAADELAPLDPDALRATGFLARNYKKLSREQWLEDTVKHTAQAFLGITLGCAKCHDHLNDPISQADYYRVRAVFEPHEVRTDRVPGELDLEKDGLPRVYDLEKPEPTYFLIRGDERRPDKDRVMQPGVPAALSGDRLPQALEITPVALPAEAAFPDKRSFVIEARLAASKKAVERAATELEKAEQSSGDVTAARLELAVGKAKDDSLQKVLRAERLEDSGGKDSAEWTAAATEAAQAQRAAALAEAQLALHKKQTSRDDLQRKLDAAAESEGGNAVEKLRKDLESASTEVTKAEEALAKAETAVSAAPGTEFQPRKMAVYPQTSSGRRSAFAQWVSSADNPLTARVAANHLWLRHFGSGIVSTPADFGGSGARPSHPALLDWLASELVASGWSMKAMHRLIVTSSTYQMASTPDEENARADGDNVYLWRMPSRRMEAELVRDNLLHVCGELDHTMGGPEVDHLEGMTSKRRSLYLRVAAEREVEFLKLFDGPGVTECYQRRPSVIPQQALALTNSELTREMAQRLAKRLGDLEESAFIEAAFQRILARTPTEEESSACAEFLAGAKARARENLVSVLLNHHEFITIR